MSIFRKREEKNILHVDHLNPVMKKAIKTLVDSGIPEVARLYGFRYLFPRIGEPIFVPYGRLDDEFKDTHEAFERILEEVNAIKDEGMKTYRAWYPTAEEIDHFRFTFYSMTKEGGMRVGIAANPLASLEQDAFRIGEVVEEISGKRVLLLTPALAGQSANTNSALAKASSVQILDFVSSRESEIVDAFIWLNKNFHDKYDKDKEYDADLGRTYMTRLFSVIKSMINSKVTNSPSADVVILPLFVYPKSKIVGNISIMEAWNSNEAFSQLLRQAQYHEIEVGPILYNAETINALVERYAFNAEKLIVLTDQKTPSLERLDYLTWVKRFKVEKETDFVKILRPAV
ncbi:MULTISPECIES: hypothetical protein [Metallosphaera]|uniref:hypothetical protein n=1 Tax=Metallosphaera TaxID=41980 RepID=UPI001F058D6D|nr:hypothetical protein [Metallosphaera sedula]MCH1770119.1 hypothetical protein [Metallosphaera sedula]MCP6728047.1 hypothetical protein [Metallosphaera sedula]